MNVFVYGTLLIPGIREIVGGRKFEAAPAVLRGFQVYQVIDADFPGIVRSDPDDIAKGEVLFDLSDAELQRMDQYEDLFYVRNSIEAVLTDTKEKVAADVYEVPSHVAEDVLSDQLWTLEWFETNHCEDYLRRLKSCYL